MQPTWIINCAGAAILLLGLLGCNFSKPSDRQEMQAALDRGVAYVQQHQLADGEYPVLFLKRSDGQLSEGHQGFSPNVFGTGIILYSLALHPDFRASASAARALDFLESQVQSNGTWIFYTPRSTRYSVFIPDVDDTAVCSLALGLYGRALPDNVGVLMKNALPDGSLHTWIYPEGFPVLDSYDNVTADEHFSIRTPDPVVNANTQAYLSSRHRPDPRISDYLNRVARAGTALDDAIYYMHLTSVAYSYAKAVQCGAVELQESVELFGQQLHEQYTAQSGWENDLQAALALNVWLTMRRPPTVVQRIASELMARQQSDGSWPAAIYFGSKRYPNRGWGSPSLTTAFAVEALTRYLAYEAAQ